MKRNAEYAHSLMIVREIKEKLTLKTQMNNFFFYVYSQTIAKVSGGKSPRMFPDVYLEFCLN